MTKFKEVSQLDENKEILTSENEAENTNTDTTAETTENSKYLTIYDGTAKKGDATSETAGWNTDFCNYMTTKSPVCIRGGRYNSGENAGIFAYSYSDGTPNWFSGFRVCLIPN